jgi:uncharacterized repeat protein (TIGR03837 family)
VTCLVPEGVARDKRSPSSAPMRCRRAATRGALTVRVLPFMPQPDYDRLLWACDLNFVRGEDSWVRAQWAGRPFVWHIYPQDENLHHKKLRAFLQKYAADIAQRWRLLAALEWRAGRTRAPLWTGPLPRCRDCHRRWERSRPTATWLGNLLQFAEV